MYIQIKETYRKVIFIVFRAMFKQLKCKYEILLHWLIDSYFFVY